jgi:hypothetical protein
MNILSTVNIIPGGEGCPCYSGPHRRRTLRFLAWDGGGVIIIPDFRFWRALAPRVGAGAMFALPRAAVVCV